MASQSESHHRKVALPHAPCAAAGVSTGPGPHQAHPSSLPTGQSSAGVPHRADPAGRQATEEPGKCPLHKLGGTEQRPIALPSIQSVSGEGVLVTEALIYKGKEGAY